MKTEKKRISIITQVALIFVAGMLIVGIITYLAQYNLADSKVKSQAEDLSRKVSLEVKKAVTEFPAYKWLVNYWYEHDDELDIEYDALFVPDTRTEAKCRLFNERHPDLQLRYMYTEEVEKLPEEDQKLFAEIAYSWLITHLNEIKTSYGFDFLYGVVTDNSFQTQYFLFSAADPGTVRGSEYLQVYPIGVEVSVADNRSLQEAMRGAVRNMSFLADAGDYTDYYYYLTMVGDKPLLIGTTYNVTSLRENIDNETLKGVVTSIFVQFILMVICLILLYQFVLKPLKTVQHSIREYQHSKDSSTVEKELSHIRSYNEIGILSDDIKSLTKELDDHMSYIEKITAERERTGAELGLASRIQESMLPNEFPAFPHEKRFDIYASMTPAKEVGGDFYDFFMTDEDHLAVTIADVSGKGVPAALFMQVSILLIRNTMMNESSPAAVLEKVNNQIYVRNKEEMFVTVWLGILNLRTGKLTAANAGHEYPAIKEPDRDFELLKDKHGFLIGGMPDVKYRDYEIMLRPGSKVFVYTDGVAEASNMNKDQFGTDRTIEALKKVQDKAPKEIIEGVRDAIKEFEDGASQYDDLTMVCVDYKGE